MQRGSMRQKRLCRFHMRRRFERKPRERGAFFSFRDWGRTGIASVCALGGGVETNGNFTICDQLFSVFISDLKIPLSTLDSYIHKRPISPRSR